uniref:RNA polymerase II-associated factor 1 homolog n=1 Tax=Styela clava TaxID=7725 RepID=UPI0019398836|nr:RNA polymerase II-associated factor 1 homolog [Styela clava]
MAPVPTIQNQKGKQDGRSGRGGTIERTGLVTRVKYCNNLPDIPFDPKFICYPFEANRFVEYKPTTLEKLHKIDLHTDHDLGVMIDLINPDTYKVDLKDTLDPADEALLEEDLPAPQDSKRSKQHSINVSWLRRSEYISQEFNRYGANNTNVETRLGAGIKELFKDDDLYKDRDSQIAAIQKTFEDAKTDIKKHYSKPNVYPVDVLPIYPDFKMWQHPSAQVIFDTDPAVKGSSPQQQIQEMSQAMIRGMVDEEGDQFVAYFLPTSGTLKKREQDNEEGMDYNPEELYDYKLAREYNWNVKNKASKGYEENYYFVMREDGVFYNELETRVRLSKRRAKGGGGLQSATNAVLAVHHRELNDQELAAQEMRRMQLEPLEADEDFDEKQDDELEEEDGDEKLEGESSAEEGEKESQEEGGEEGEEEEEEAAGSSESESEDKKETTTQDEEEEDASEHSEEEVEEKKAESSSASSSDENEQGEEEGENRQAQEIFGSESDSSGSDSD